MEHFIHHVTQRKKWQNTLIEIRLAQVLHRPDFHPVPCNPTRFPCSHTQSSHSCRQPLPMALPCLPHTAIAWSWSCVQSPSASAGPQPYAVSSCSQSGHVHMSQRTPVCDLFKQTVRVLSTVAVQECLSYGSPALPLYASPSLLGSENSFGTLVLWTLFSCQYQGTLQCVGCLGYLL